MVQWHNYLLNGTITIAMLIILGYMATYCSSSYSSEWRKPTNWTIVANLRTVGHPVLLMIVGNHPQLITFIDWYFWPMTLMVSGLWILPHAWLVLNTSAPAQMENSGVGITWLLWITGWCSDFTRPIKNLPTEILPAWWDEMIGRFDWWG